MPTPTISSNMENKFILLTSDHFVSQIADASLSISLKFPVNQKYHVLPFSLTIYSLLTVDSRNQTHNLLSPTFQSYLFFKLR